MCFFFFFIILTRKAHGWNLENTALGENVPLANAPYAKRLYNVFNTKRRYMKDYVHKLGFSFQFDQTTQINFCSQWLQNSELAYPIVNMLGN